MTSDTLITVILAGSVVVFTYIVLFIKRKPKSSQTATTKEPKESCPYLESISKVDENGDTKLMIACGEGDLKEVQKLLQTGTKNIHSSIPNTTTETTKGKCPFQFGSMIGTGNVVTAQLNDVAVVDVNAVNDDGETALMFAAENGHDHVVRLLLDTTHGTRDTTLFLTPYHLLYSHFCFCPCRGAMFAAVSIPPPNMQPISASATRGSGVRCPSLPVQDT